MHLVKLGTQRLYDIDLRIYLATFVLIYVRNNSNFTIEVVISALIVRSNMKFESLASVIAIFVSMVAQSILGDKTSWAYIPG